MMTIGERWEATGGRPSGFDYVRIVLAVSVLLWHSYQVSYGTEAAIAFWRDSPVGLLLQLILPLFFSLSGFLVAGSMYRNPNLRVFLSLRAIRIFPALAVDVAVSALIIGPIFTVFTLREYFASPLLHQYFFNVLGYIHYYLPGVFLNNPEPGIVNSQLWTIPFELECYIFISFCALVGFFKFRRSVLPIFAISTVGVAVWNFTHGVLAAPYGGIDGRVLVLSFLAGVVTYSYRDKISWRLDWAVVAMIASMALPRLPHGATYLMPLFGSYLVVYLGLLNPKRSIIVSSGDYSYGVYLYSCPIQQAIAQMLGDQGSWAANVALSLPIAVAFALASWWFVEKPFQKVKKYVLAGSRPVRPLAT